MTPRTAGYALLAGAFGLAALTACEEERGGTPDVERRAAESRNSETSEFRSTTDLLRSIEEGTFAERVGTPEPPEPQATVPEAIKIAFVSGSKVPDDQLARLEALAGRLRADTSLRVEVLGCSDPSGSEAVNLRVSRARAESVATKLRGLGVSAQQIAEVVGRGEGCEVQERAVHVTPSRREELD